jgi:hypothetical protein
MSSLVLVAGHSGVAVEKPCWGFQPEFCHRERPCRFVVVWTELLVERNLLMARADLATTPMSPLSPLLQTSRFSYFAFCFAAPDLESGECLYKTMRNFQGKGLISRSEAQNLRIRSPSAKV